MRRSGESATPAVAIALAVGLGLASGIVALVRLAHARTDPSSWLDARWTSGFALAVALAALGLSWCERTRPRRRAPLLRSVLAVCIAGLSLAAWLNLGNVLVHPYHRWEHFHYVLGSKYFPELGYELIYECTAVAEAERFGSASVARRGIRDLSSDTIVPASHADAARCHARFSAERWAAFARDVEFFRTVSPRAYWSDMQSDHGFNPPPAWTVSGRALASLAPASEATEIALAAIDPVLIGLGFALIGWAFGAHIAWVAIVVWGCSFPAGGGWTFGAFLRQDWYLACVASVCLARRDRRFASGAALATAAAFRIFPVLLLAVPLGAIAVQTARARSLSAAYRRFGFGLVAGGAFWLLLSSALFGPSAWVGFAHHLAAHRAAPLANHVGLRALLSQSWDGRLAVAQERDALDPYRPWKEARRATFARRSALYATAVVLTLALSVAAALRVRRLWRAIAASALLVVVGVDLASYYWSFFVALALLAALGPEQELLALGAMVLSRLAVFVPAALHGGNPSYPIENADLLYAMQSAIFIVWALLALALLVRPIHLRSVLAAGDRGSA